MQVNSYAQQKNEVKGQVKDDSGQPISFVTVLATNSKTSFTAGAQSDSMGVFKFTNLPAGGPYSFTVSSVGYETQTLAGYTIKDGANITLLVKLKSNVQALDQVVVIGYGTQRKRDLTTAIGSLRQEDLDQPVASVDQAIAGKLAGVQVAQPNGIPGGGLSIRVRGSGSISAGNDPLYVVDGFPMSDAAGNATGIYVSPLSTINPNDIESIEVLKDASAAAIYGSRGANGVVIITTKKGKKERTTFNYDTYSGFQSTTKKIKMLDAYQWAQICLESRNNTYLDALNKAGLTGSIDDPNSVRLAKFGRPANDITQTYTIPDIVYPYLNNTPGLTNTDWQHEVLRNAFLTNHNLSVSGGSNSLQYFLSANYRKEDGIVIATGFNEIGTRAKLDARFGKFSIGSNLSFNNSGYAIVPTEDRYSNETILSTALGMVPAFPVYNADGSYNYDQYTINHRLPALINPVALANLRKDKMKRNRFLGSAYVEYEIAKNLKVKTSLGTDYNSFRRDIFRPSTLPKSNLLPPTIPTGEAMTKDVNNWLWDNTISYNFNIRNEHKFNAVAGWSVQKESSAESNIQGTGYPNDLVQTLNAATAATSWSSYQSEWSLASGLARLQYNYKNKYLLSGAIRADGSSRFGQKNRWGYFPSVSAGWYVSEEDFMKNVSWINQLKLRASYGISGNFSIGNYAYYAGLGVDNYVLGNTPVLNSGLYPSSAGNPELGWEKTAMLNIGLDFGMFSVLNITVDAYSGNTSSLLLNVPVPEFSGFSTVLKNIGKLNNKGIEVSASTKNRWGKLSWQNQINFSMNRNKVVSLGGVDQILVLGETMQFITKVGQPIGNYYALITNGIYLNQKEVATGLDANGNVIAKVPNAHPGDFKFLDINSDGVIDANDKTIVGNYMPDFTYGFSSNLVYSDVDLSFDLQGVYGNEIANINRRYLDNMEGGSNMVDALNRWVSETNAGNGLVNRANRSSTGMNGQMSTWHIEDGSYLRIRNITLGYTLPKNRLKLDNFRVYLSAQNPFTFTKYSGYNPEVSKSADPLTPGIDYGTYPLSKSFVVGLNIKL